MPATRIHSLPALFCAALCAIVPMRGASQTRLSSGLPAAHQVIDFVVPAVGDRVIYRTGPKGPSFPHVQSQLFAVPTAGGAVTSLTSFFTGFTGAADYTVTPNGQQIVMRTNIDGPNTYSLFRTPPTGGILQRISGASTPLPRVWGGPYPTAPGHGPFVPRERGLTISHDSQTAFFLAEKATTGVLQLFTVQILGGFLPTELTAYSGQGGVAPDGFRLTRDSEKVVFISDHVTSGVFELYAGPTNLPFATKLNSSPLMDMRSTPRTRFANYPLLEISPDGQWVVFSACGGNPQNWELFSAPIGGGTVRRLHGNPAAGGIGIGGDILFSADSRIVYFSASITNRTLYDLVATDLQTGAPVIVSPAPTDLPWKVAVTRAPAGIAFWNHKLFWPFQAYRAAPNGTGRALLYDGSFDLAHLSAGGDAWIGMKVNRSAPTGISFIRAPLSGGAVQEFPRSDFTDAYDFYPAPNRNALVFIGTSAAGTHLHQLHMDTGNLFRLSPSSQGPRGVLDNEQQLFFSPDGARVFYIADDNGVMHLYSNALANAGNAADGVWLEVP